jgi:hypothetical protein
MRRRNSQSSPKSEDNSTSSSAALFYLTSTNYSEVESAYLTSEEVGFHDDIDDDFEEDDYDDSNHNNNYYNTNQDDLNRDGEDRAKGGGGITTPKCSNSRHGTGSGSSGGRMGETRDSVTHDGNPFCKEAANGQLMGSYHPLVHLNPLMSSLLGVDVLPRIKQESTRSKSGSKRRQHIQTRNSGKQSFDVLHDSSRDAYSFDDDDDDDDDEYDDDEYDEAYNDDMPVVMDRPLIDLGVPISNNVIPKYARRRGPIRRLKRQLANNNKQEKQKRKHHKRRARGKAKHHELINDASIDIDHCILQVELARKRLQSVKSDLKFTQARAKKLMLGAQQSANRVSKLSKNIVELECKLDMSLRALEQERDVIHKNLAKLSHLHAMERSLEDEANDIECHLRDYLVHGERRSMMTVSPLSSSMTSRRVFKDDGRSDDIGGDVASRRQRAGTDASFMTAKQPSPTNTAMSFGSSIMRKRSASHNDLRSQSTLMGYQKSSHSHVSQSGKTSSSRRVLNQLPSFLRIHDLEMDESHLKSKSNDRPDLFPIHSDDSHHALNALMKLGLKYATDESSRWTPDRGTESILSKRPTSEQKWHCATESDIFVWYGKLDTGYKSELPVIKARAMVKTSARNLLDLLADSSKVKEYNKMSLGREDKAFIKKGLETNNGNIQGEAKIVRSLSNVPMIRKKLELVSLMYARALDEKTDGIKGYIIVNRSVWEDENRAPTADGAGDTGSDCNYIRSEILLGVNLIRDIDQENKCEITTINHFYTPGTPTFGARQFGMKAASNFLRDLQKQFE